MKELEVVHKTLHQIALALNDSAGKELLLEEWLKYHELEGKVINHNSIKITNGVIPAIHLYPDKMKLMFQEKGKNYIITSNEDSSIVALIKGDMPFKRYPQ